MKVSGIVFLVLGIVGTIIFGVQIINQSESLSIFGFDLGVSSANLTPLIISLDIFLIGVIFIATTRKSTS